MDIKDIKKLSYDEIDAAISNRQAEIEANISKMKPFQDEISRLEFEIKNLREVKSQKIIDDSKQSIVDSKIDFSLEEFQQFLLSKKVSEKNLKAKSAKKIHNKKNDDKIFSPPTTSKKYDSPETLDEKNLVVHPDDFLNSPPPVDEKKISAETSTQKFTRSDSEKLTDEEKEMLHQFRAKQLATKNSFGSQKPITNFQNLSAQEKEDLMPTGLPDEIVQKYKKTFNEENV